MAEYRKSTLGVYPVGRGEWRYQVVDPRGGSISGGGYRTETDARAAGKRQARFQDKLERDRVDGVKPKRGTKVLEKGLRLCNNCGEPHDLVITTRRGRRWGQTWAKPGCGVYQAESWESFARRTVEAQAA